ncbi:MAG: hypothetical protein Q8R15_04860 [Candidatus Micrarchaeota archaeon]|nr:hypothetical protein [Candidatus Micrarchaeota archaeon]
MVSAVSYDNLTISTVNRMSFNASVAGMGSDNILAIQGAKGIIVNSTIPNAFRVTPTFDPALRSNLLMYIQNISFSDSRIILRNGTSVPATQFSASFPVVALYNSASRKWYIVEPGERLHAPELPLIMPYYYKRYSTGEAMANVSFEHFESNGRGTVTIGEKLLAPLVTGISGNWRTTYDMARGEFTPWRLDIPGARDGLVWYFVTDSGSVRGVKGPVSRYTSPRGSVLNRVARNSVSLSYKLTDEYN